MTARLRPDSSLVARFIPSPNYGERRGYGGPNCLILHYTGMPTGEAALRALTDPACQVSSHYLIWEEGSIDQMVAESDRARQLVALRSQLRHAWDTVPYYRAAWTKAGVHPADVRELRDLEAFPVVTKADIRRHLADLLGLDVGDVNVKAKTGEKVGAIGRAEAIACQAVVLIDRDESAEQGA